MSVSVRAYLSGCRCTIRGLKKNVCEPFLVLMRGSIFSFSSMSVTHLCLSIVWLPSSFVLFKLQKPRRQERHLDF